MGYLDLNYGISGVYAIKNSVNGKVYLGSAVDIKRRWTAHVHRLRSGKHTNPILQNSWNKHGESNFNFTILEEVPDKTQLLAREQVWLDDTEPWKRENGYNILQTAESRFGHKASKETRKKLSVALKGRKRGPITESQRQALINSHLGKPWTEKRRKSEATRDFGFITADWCKAISLRTTGNKNPFHGKRHPKDIQNKISAKLRGRKLSEEHCLKISLGVRGDKHPFYGKHHSEETRSKIRQKHDNKCLHVRWHVNRGISKPDCKFCLGGS